MRLDAAKLLKIYRKEHAKKENFRDMYERAYNLAIPNRNLYNDPQEGQRRNFRNYSSLGQQTTDRFVNHMQSSLTPPFKRWAELQAGERLPDQIRDPLNKIYSEATKIGFELLNASNFSVAVAEGYYDLAVGTMCMIVREGDDNSPVMFETIHPKEVTIKEDAFGQPQIIFRKHKVEAAQIKEVWPGIKLTADLQRTIKSNPLSEVEFLTSTYKVGRQYYYDVMHCESNESVYKATMSRSGWVIVRIGKVPGEAYGRGPIVIALEDLQMYNKAKELQIKSAQLTTFGLYTVADNDIMNPNTIVLSPGMFIPVSRNGTNPSIAPLPGSGNLDMQQFMLGDLQNDIKSIMMNDRLPPEIGAVRSATEYQARTQSRQIDVQSYFGRLQHEFVQPTWENLVTIMYERELLGDIPPEFATVDNLILQVRVVSPLAKEQGIIDMQNTIQTIQAAQAIAGPDIVNASYKMEDLPYILARDSGMTADLIRTTEERTSILAQQQQDAAMQQEMLLAQQQQ